MATKLEELGEEFRKENIVKNHYRNDPGKEYGANSADAIGNGDVRGKGAGDGSNADNINTSLGGNRVDTETREALIAKNQGKYDIGGGKSKGFGPDVPYYPNYINSQTDNNSST